MEIKTYYWNDRILPTPLFKLLHIFCPKTSRYFKIGNAGDIYTKNLISEIYNSDLINTKEASGRLLLVGSIAHMVRENDIICGIGYKGILPPAPRNNLIIGVRGPITYDIFKKQEYDMSNFKFQLDPGLYIKFLIKPDLEIKKNSVIFIPHYRERFIYNNMPSEIELVDIDSDPIKLANKIATSELVYSSSLHGIIFAHSLGRPCILVQPQTVEPIIKYEDYYLSINQELPKPLNSIYDYNFQRDFHSPLDLKLKKSQFYFPKIKSLFSSGIAIE